MKYAIQIQHGEASFLAAGFSQAFHQVILATSPDAVLYFASRPAASNFMTTHQLTEPQSQIVSVTTVTEVTTTEAIYLATTLL